jgi:hypothetical protein
MTTNVRFRLNIHTHIYISWYLRSCFHWSIWSFAIPLHWVLTTITRSWLLKLPSTFQVDRRYTLDYLILCVSYQERLTANHSGFLFWSVPSFLHAKDPFYKFWKKSRLILAATIMLFYIFPIYLSILLQWQSKIVTSFIPLHLYYLSLQYNTIYWLILQGRLAVFLTSKLINKMYMTYTCISVFLITQMWGYQNVCMLNKERHKKSEIVLFAEFLYTRYFFSNVTIKIKIFLCWRLNPTTILCQS